MKRQGELYNYFAKRSKSGSPGISSHDSLHTSQESQREIPSPPSPASLREDTDTSDQDDDLEPVQVAVDHFPAVSTFAPPKGPSDISRSKAEGPVQPSLSQFPRTQHGTHCCWTYK
ncbi:hypothetical protein AALO_G00027100 [Alosa alosa]|uniref:Uncharacterized protein n=1 Tax=Alosa alosa TaxID=278164 RepID=A0AAV6HF20_9TELE|nr:hypothetical protein AALO_G00027100 [Alosa alosa]